MEAQSQVWRIWDQMILDTSPHTLPPPLGLTEGVGGKTPLGVPVCQEETDVKGGLRGTLGVSQLWYQDPGYQRLRGDRTAGNCL